VIGTLAGLDWLVIGVYLALALGAGLWFRERSRGSMENFFLSGRNLPWWLAGTSMVATSFASDTPLVITGWTRDAGVAGNWRWWGYVVSVLLVVVLFSRFWKRSRVLTDIEFMELRYSGRPARALRGFKSIYQVIFMHCFVMGWVMLGMTKVMEVVFQLETGSTISLGLFEVTPAVAIMLGCCVLALVYSEITGLWGVVITDFVQFLLALAGALVLAWMVVDDFGGIGPLVDALKAAPVAAGKLSAAPDTTGVVLSDPSTWNREFWQFAVFIGVIWFATKNTDGSGVMVQRLLASKNEKHAMGAALWYSLAHNALRPWPWIIVALASLLVLPPVSVATPTDGVVTAVSAQEILVQASDGTAVNLSVPSTGVEGWAASPRVTSGAQVVAGQVVASTDDEEAYPEMMRRYLPAGLLGLMIASFLAAFMSTIDTHVNLASSYLVNDAYKRFVKPDAPPAHYVRVARFMGPAVLLIALGFGLNAESVRGMFDVFSALFSGVGVVYLLRWLWWRINAWSEITALVVGAAVTWTMELRPDWAVALLPEPLTEAGQPVFPGTLLIVIAVALPLTILVTLLTPSVDRATLKEFYDRIRPLGAWGPLRTPGESHGRFAGLRVIIAWIGATAFVVACILLPGDLLLEGGKHTGLWIGVGVVGLLGLAVQPSVLSRHASDRP
jgi:solute:Na+ symporter, SSS family